FSRACSRAVRQPEDPAVALGASAFRRTQLRREPGSKGAVAIGARERERDAVGVVLIAGARLGWHLAVPERRIGFGNDRAPRRNGPPIVGPEMHAFAELLPQIPQPRKPGMGGLRH